MKTAVRLFSVGAVFSACIMLSPVSGHAQDPCADTDAITAADAKVRDNFPKLETRQIAIDAGKEYISKYGTCEVSKAFVDWLKPLIPAWEKQVQFGNERSWARPRFDKFDNGIKTAKYDDAYAAGAELLTKYPDNMNVILPLGFIGLYESYKDNFKYNDDTIRYANIAIDQFIAGAVEPKKDKDGKPILDKTNKEIYGSFQFERNKEEALSELNYTIAYINYYAKKDHKAALPYYYAVSQMPGIYKDEPRLYLTLAAYYGEESAPLSKAIVDLIAKQKTAPTDDEKIKLDTEFKARAALFNGYLERSLDAYSRAYNVADEKLPAEKKIKDDVYRSLQVLYEQRFGKKEGLDAYISAASKNPLPDPTTAVLPVSDPEPDTAPAVSSATKPASVIGKPVPVKPANSKVTTGAKP